MLGKVEQRIILCLEHPMLFRELQSKFIDKYKDWYECTPSTLYHVLFRNLESLIRGGFIKHDDKNYLRTYSLTENGLQEYKNLKYNVAIRNIIGKVVERFE